MRVIVPIVIVPGTPGVDTRLTTTNVAENDATLWSAGTYNTGTQRLYNHKLYQVVASPSTTDQPDVGAAKVSPTWLDLGYANRWEMFDAIVNSQTSNSGTIAVTITPGKAVNALALFNLVGTTVTVTMTDPIAGLVFNQTLQLQDNSAIVDGYTYCFEDIIQRRDVVVTGMPSFINAVISVTIDAGVGTAKCGELVIGRARTIGTALFGTGVGIQSYSTKTRDTYGNVTIVARSSAKRTEFDVDIDTNLVDGVQNFLTDIENEPCVFIGDENRSSTIVYGFFKEFTILLEDAGSSHCSLEVEGLT